MLNINLYAQRNAFSTNALQMPYTNPITVKWLAVSKPSCPVLLVFEDDVLTTTDRVRALTIYTFWWGRHEKIVYKFTVLCEKPNTTTTITADSKTDFTAWRGQETAQCQYGLVSACYIVRWSGICYITPTGSAPHRQPAWSGQHAPAFNTG